VPRTSTVPSETVEESIGCSIMSATGGCGFGGGCRLEPPHAASGTEAARQAMRTGTGRTDWRISLPAPAEYAAGFARL
jgi:hypothetical protein